MLDRAEAELRDLLGPLVYGVDGESMESVVLDLLRSQGLTLAVAESLTGGLVAARLTAIPGASDVLRGAVVSYASEVKFDLLERGGRTGRQRAGGGGDGRRRSAVLGADVGLGLTGVAGPAEQDDVAVGTVCIGVALPTGSHATTLRLGTEREQIRQFAVISALDLLRVRSVVSDGQLPPRRPPRVGDTSAPVTTIMVLAVAAVAVIAGFIILRSITEPDDQAAPVDPDLTPVPSDVRAHPSARVRRVRLSDLRWRQHSDGSLERSRQDSNLRTAD